MGLQTLRVGLKNIFVKVVRVFASVRRGRGPTRISPQPNTGCTHYAGGGNCFLDSCCRTKTNKQVSSTQIVSAEVLEIFEHCRVLHTDMNTFEIILISLFA